MRVTLLYFDGCPSCAQRSSVGERLRGVVVGAGVLAGLCIAAALTGRLLEAVGVTRCGCATDCWCRRPALSTLRWAVPFWHRSAAPDPRDALSERPAPASAAGA